MTQEIVDAVKVLEQEKGISADTLMDALADALLSAYRKTPGAARYARVDLDHETGDFRVFELTLPEELEEKLLEQAKAAAAAEAERIRTAAKGEVDREIAVAREVLKGKVGELAVLGASRILKREVDAKAHADVIGELAARI